MSLLSSFLTNQLVKELESEFLAIEPELQEGLITEVTEFANTIVSWVNSKIATKNPTEAPK